MFDVDEKPDSVQTLLWPRTYAFFDVISILMYLTGLEMRFPSPVACHHSSWFSNVYEHVFSFLLLLIGLASHIQELLLADI